jgi:hypothetical protein
MTKILNQIDKYLDNKKTSDVYLLRICLFLIVSFLVYNFIYTTTKQKFDEVKNKQIDIKMNLEQSDQKLQILIANKNEQELSNLKEKLKLLKEHNDFLETKFNQLNALVFDEKKWTNFLDNLTLLAIDNDIKIIKIQNNIKNKTSYELNEVIQIDIEFNSNFKNIVKYINKIEESVLLVDIRDITLLVDQNELKAMIKILIYGVKY